MKAFIKTLLRLSPAPLVFVAVGRLILPDGDQASGWQAAGVVTAFAAAMIVNLCIIREG